MKVVKFSGEIVDFNKDKLEKSLLKSGATLEQVQNVLLQIEPVLYDGIRTKEIYKTAFQFLKEEANSCAARYNLRYGLELLGTDGFYFEKFMSHVFKAEGYEVIMNLILEGKCVTHEIDILIKKENQISMVECKFHSSREGVSDVKVPMYILSRFNDLKKLKHPVFNSVIINHCIIVTNTRFSEDALKFANCNELEMLSWNYPNKNGLKSRVEKHKIYPVTCLSTITEDEKIRLLENEVIVISQILHDTSVLKDIGLGKNRIQNLIEEVKGLC